MYTEELELRRNFEDFRRMYGKDTLLEEYEETVLSLNNPALSAYFALLGGANAQKHGAIVLESNNLEAIYELSDKYPEHLQYILDSHDVKYNLRSLKKLLEQGVHAYGRALIKKDYTEVAQIRERIAKHVEAISYSDDIAGIFEFLNWYEEAIQRKINYHYGIPHDDWVDTICIGRNLLDDSTIYFNNLIRTISKVNNPQELYTAINELEKIKRYISQNRLANIKTKKLHKALASTKDAEHNYLILEEHPNYSDELFLLHENAVIASKDAGYNYAFAYRFRTKADILRHQEVIIESGDAHFCYRFAADVKGADLKRLEEVVINSGDAESCYLFAKDIKDADLKRLGEKVIASKDPKYNYLFARDIPNSNKKEHCRAVAESDDAKYNYLCCFLGNGDHYENKLAVIRSENAEYNYYLALKFPDDPLYDEFLKVVISSGRAEYISELNNLKPVMIQNINKKLKLLQRRI